MPLYTLFLYILVLVACPISWYLNRRRNPIPHETSSSQTTRETSTASASSAPDGGSDRAFDVFLNVRGPDSRHTVADALYHGLTKAGCRVFLDNEDIRKGDVIEGELLGAITSSRIYIPIFSKDYASSRWCLRELAIMINCWETSSDDTKKVILPIFFDVDADEDVKLRSELYTTALQKHKKEIGEATVKLWERALRQVASIKGWNLKDHGMAELVHLIKREVFSRLTVARVIYDPPPLVGIHDQMVAIMQLLEMGSPQVRYIVIHGMAGIGKTTIANAVFEKITSIFQGSCILRDVRRSSGNHDAVRLLEKLLADTLRLRSVKLADVDDGIQRISRRLHNQKVLLLLDDVDREDHLLSLAAQPHWFGRGSRIIITTRDTEFLQNRFHVDPRYRFYEMKELVYEDAFRVFCQYAFDRDYPPLEYHDISAEIVDTTGGLPLALQCIGSALYNRDIEAWKFRLEELKYAPHKDVQKTLMISYDALEHEAQQIFLDIACFFSDKKKMDPILFWESCNLYPYRVIKTLMHKSLIKVNDDGKLWMHDQLRDLGRAIAQSEIHNRKGQSLAEPSRLWSPEIALGEVRKRERAQSVVGLRLGTLDDGCCFAQEEFAGIENLRFLELEGGNFEGNFKNVLEELRWLSWSNCPPKFEATNLSFKKLAVLKLSGSEITEDWDGWGLTMSQEALKVLHLRGCKHLKRTPNFCALPELRRLTLKDCSELEVVDPSISDLKNLDYLNISADSSQDMAAGLQVLPDSIGDLKSLTLLKIENIGLKALHPSIGNLVNLKRLYLLRCPHLTNLPDSIGNLTLLEELDISSSAIEKLPDSIGNLNQLNILRMNQTAIEYLPESIGRLQSLIQLNLSETEITQFPKTIGNLKRLKAINLGSTMIKSLPKALGEMENLEELLASGCDHIEEEIPEEIGKLSSLKILDLFNFNGNIVPTPGDQVLDRIPKMVWLRRLLKMEKLRLVLPNLILPPTDLNSLSCLRMLDITCFDPRSLTNLPSSLEFLSLYDIKSPINWQLFSGLSNLSTLVLSRCWLEEIKVDGPEQVMNNIHLHFLTLEGCQFIERLCHLTCLEKLEVLYIADCPNLVDIQDLGDVESLQSLELRECHSIRRLPDLERLKKLELLCFMFCGSLESIPEVDGKAPCHLEVTSCRHFDDFKGPYLEHHRAFRI